MKRPGMKARMAAMTENMKCCCMLFVDNGLLKHEREQLTDSEGCENDLIVRMCVL